MNIRYLIAHITISYVSTKISYVSTKILRFSEMQYLTKISYCRRIPIENSVVLFHTGFKATDDCNPCFGENGFRSCDGNYGFSRDLILMKVSELNSVVWFIVRSVCRQSC